MKKNLTSLLSLFFLFVSSLFVSCFNNNNLAEPAGGSIEFYIPGSVFQRSAGVMKAENDLSAFTVQVDLVSDAGRNTKTAALSNEGTSISFENLLVGLSVYAEAKILYGDLVVAQGTSDPIIIQTGSNPIKVTMKYLFNGVLEIGLEKNVTLVKNTQASSAEIWLNKGEFAFSLLDDEGNDILSDVDWTYKKTAEGGVVGAGSYEEEVNQDLLLVQARLKKNHREISLVPQTAFNKVMFSNMTGDAFPAAGSYELTLIVGPNKKTYVNSEGKEELFPQFEPVSETFTIEVLNAYNINMTSYESQDAFSGAFTTVISKLSGNQRKIGFSGTANFSYDSICGVIKNIIDSESSVYDLDMGELTTNDSDKGLGVNGGTLFQNCTKISSIIMPDDTSVVGNCSFMGCTALKYVRFGSAVTRTEQDVFSDCSLLETVEFPEDCALKIIEGTTFADTALTSITIPKNVIAISAEAFRGTSCVVTLADKSGQWFTVGKETYSGQTLWTSFYSGSASPFDSDTWGSAPEDLVAEMDVNNINNYINNYYYLYCVK